MGVKGDSSHRKIYAAVARIPRGRVATYGQIARLCGLSGQARLVGYALSALPEKSRLAWHRVVNAEGRISIRSDGSPMGIVQRLRLQHEGVRFDKLGRIRLARYQWHPREDPRSISMARRRTRMSVQV
jgi:methylated-DNA-protein-cysteine methyltransferase related protein